MNFLLDPNVAYLLLMLGIACALMAISSPGSGIMEAGAVILFIIVGIALANISFNLWALIVLLAGVIPFAFLTRYTKHWLPFLVCLASLITGSLFLFQTDNGMLAIDPVLATITSLIITGFVWLVIRKGMIPIAQPRKNTSSKLAGKIGDAETDIGPDYHEGSVLISGENWTAKSREFIPAGCKVVVIRRDGLYLIVEKSTR